MLWSGKNIFLTFDNFQPKEMDDPRSINIIFSLTEAVGALAEALKIFKEHNVNLLHIESRSSVRVPGYEFMVEVRSLMLKKEVL